MRKWISLLLVMLLVLTPATAFAEDGSIRHEVYGDVSKFDVSEELSEGKADGKEAQMGTEVWLFVDPDTASYITFYVTDEEGEPLKDALIYVTYNGITEFFGSTDKDGKLKTYLFRNVEYGYTCKKKGYETASGTFYCPRETGLVHIVLRKYWPLEVYVVDGGAPVKGVQVIIEGADHYTDRDGKVVSGRTDGVYDVVVVTEDGRYIHTKATVDKGGRIVVDIALDDSIVPGGRYTDRYLVYDKVYDPEDYVLSRYIFDDKYEDELTNTILIEAQPDRRQGASGDTDVLDEDGKPLYSQRSLMPSGFVLKAWEEQGYEELVFENEEMALRFELESLHSKEMMKLYGIVSYFSDYGVELEDIVTDTVRESWNGYEGTGLREMTKWELELKDIDFNALREFSFRFDEQENTKVLPDSYYTNSMFEFRITPILPEALREMVEDGLRRAQSLPKDEIMLASWGYYSEQLRRWLAEGQLSEAEYDELYEFFVDSRLSAEEIEELREKYAEGTLSEEELDFIIEAAADENLYRASCWLMYNDIEVDISGIVEGLELIRVADRQFEEICQQIKAEHEDIEEDELIEKAEAGLMEYAWLLVEPDLERYANKAYKPGEFSKSAAVVLEKALDEDGELYEELCEMSFEQLVVDVREESISLGGESCGWYRAYITGAETMLSQMRVLVCEHQGSVLKAMEK